MDNAWFISSSDRDSVNCTLQCANPKKSVTELSQDINYIAQLAYQGNLSAFSVLTDGKPSVFIELIFQTEEAWDRFGRDFLAQK